MAKKIRLDIVSPERLVYSADVDMVIARTTTGDIGILPGHAPLVAGLQIWPLCLLNDEGELPIAVSSGFIEVQPEKVTVLAACAELPEEIDINRAKEAKARAEARLKGSTDAKHKIDAARAEAALQRAMLRLTVSRQSSQ